MKREKKEAGITLIALVITVIVLLILAGVTIAALNGDNGILTRAKDAKEKTEQAQKNEEKTLSDMERVLGSIDFDNVNLQDTNPAGAMPSDTTILENDANKGIVIKDINNNEWVWVEVPKTTVFEDLKIDTTKELTDQNYNDIKNKLIEYVGIYRNGSVSQTRNNWKDEWYDGCSITSEKYTEAYQKMLKSIYTYGGFWIGRYEAGIEGTTTETTNARTSSSSRIAIETSPKAISQKDAIPYNYVYCSEAQTLAKEMTPNSNYTSSLMFGIQWDLVCKYLEVKGRLTTADINSNSTSWGNYENAKIENIISGKYAVYKNESLGTWTKISGRYTKTNTGPDYYTLLSTGISEYTNKMNIYAFAGNEWEWTLEHATSNSNSPCACRGGGYYYSGSNYPASYRKYLGMTDAYNDVSFRPTFYVK